MKTRILALALVLIIGLSACSRNNTDAPNSDASTFPSAASTTPNSTPSQVDASQSQDTEQEDFPVRIGTSTLPDGKQILYIYLDLPNTGNYTFDGYVGESHITSEPYFENRTHPTSILYDSSGNKVEQTYAGNIDPWGVELQVVTSDYDWGFENISTVRIECTSDIGSTISGEFDFKSVLVENGKWYSNLQRRYDDKGESNTPSSSSQMPDRGTEGDESFDLSWFSEENFSLQTDISDSTIKSTLHFDYLAEAYPINGGKVDMMLRLHASDYEDMIWAGISEVSGSDIFRIDSLQYPSTLADSVTAEYDYVNKNIIITTKLNYTVAEMKSWGSFHIYLYVLTEKGSAEITIYEN